jgi:Domain of unknown function (DUF3850)
MAVRTHVLKCWPEPFTAVMAGLKRYEIRHDDRGFMVSDRLRLREWEPHGRSLTGRELVVEVTYITPGGAWGLPTGLCVMSISPVSL